MQREQELLLNYSAMAGMRNMVATAMRTIPLRRRIDTFHSVSSQGQLPRFSTPLASRRLGSKGSLLRVA